MITDNGTASKKHVQSFGFKKHVCVVCGKKFECQGEYVYKKPNNNKFDYYCSYHCMRVVQKKMESKYA